MVERRIEELKKQLGPDWEHVGGGVDREEEVVPTPGGIKSKRRPDITLRNKKTGEVYRENVGLVDSEGEPIRRDGEALDDIEKQTGARPKFTPYGKQ